MKLYVRIRGRVHGPFDDTKLENMVRRGQLSRIHQVSEDGHNWTRASEHPDLFASRQAPAGESIRLESDGNNQRVADRVENVATEQPLAVKSTQWYYARNNEPQGPVSAEGIVRLLESGEINDTTKVWRDGFADWVEAGKVQELGVRQVDRIPSFQAVTDSHETRQVDSRLAHLTSDAGGWATFLAVLGYILASIFFVSSILLLINSGRDSTGVIASNAIFSGITGLIQVTILAYGSTTLLVYARACKSFARTSRDSFLIEATRILRGFWVFCSIVLLLYIAGLILLIILAFSFISSLL